MQYNHQNIERKWQNFWSQNKIYEVEINRNKPKFYLLDMFPYPSGSGLHVGHPLGYIASDIYSRFKRLKGFNVLHPIGFDAFGLPAEQYAIETGQHPAITTENNILRYKEQLQKMGFCYDWSREVKTCDPGYYKWTQWIFLQLFNSWFDIKKQKARPVVELIEIFRTNGNKEINAANNSTEIFTAKQWVNKTELEKNKTVLNYRLMYLADSEVNWCPFLGTVLANDEVKDGVSERGGHPVEKRKMKQWFMRITAFAERLQKGLEKLDWSPSMKEMQKNWIGKSEGAEIVFAIDNLPYQLTIFTTRPDTIFGATFMVIAPEHKLVSSITSNEQKAEVEKYLMYVKTRSERERMTDVDKITGVFTGSYAINPLNNKKVPVWVSEYVLAGYGTGAIMAVPGHDTRDYRFAKYFNLPIIQVIEGADITKDSFDDTVGKMINSDFVNGLEVNVATNQIIKKVEELEIGKRKINYKLRDAAFSRQRYWGEPFPIYYKEGIPYAIHEKQLPVKLPEINSYKPSNDGNPPLARAINWNTQEGYEIETSTMPGYAGSSWYWLRYMDSKNEKEFVGNEAEKYWQNVDLYIGGAEHAVGHLIYSRFWNKVLFDLGYISNDEPFKKLVNQGMIQGRSNFVYRDKVSGKFISYGLIKKYDTSAIHVDVNLVENDILNIDKFKLWREDFKHVEFVLENEKYICGFEVEKMSKSRHNVVNPDDIIEKYGADTLRMYEMFLGPVEDHKPWNTNGIEGVYKFLKKTLRLFYDENGNFLINESDPNEEELKILHKTLRKIEEDIEKLSFNTSVSAFMICVNELTARKCYKKEILKQFLICLSPFAPHICEELWFALGNKESIVNAVYPNWEQRFLTQSTFECPVSINGKVRTKIQIPLDLTQTQVLEQIMDMESVKKWLDGKEPKKFIYVPKRIVNIVI